MRVIRFEELAGTAREVRCPQGGFTSIRAILAQDGMGFSVHKTVIPVGVAQHWHYTHHLEACYCISGRGLLTNLTTGVYHAITPDTLYVLDQHDDHTFEALAPTVLLSIFNPPVVGGEVHQADGSYAEASHVE